MSQKQRAITSELAGVQGELSCTRIEQQKLLKQLHEERQANRDAQVQLQSFLAAERAEKEVSTDCGLWTAEFVGSQLSTGPEGSRRFSTEQNLKMLKQLHEGRLHMMLQ